MADIVERFTLYFLAYSVQNSVLFLKVWDLNSSLICFTWLLVNLAEELGVSDNAIGKHIKKLGLTKSPRGYWAKLYNGKI